MSTQEDSYITGPTTVATKVDKRLSCICRSDETHREVNESEVRGGGTGKLTLFPLKLFERVNGLRELLLLQESHRLVDLQLAGKEGEVGRLQCFHVPIVACQSAINSISSYFMLIYINLNNILRTVK